MKYSQLKTFLDELTPEQLDQDVTIFWLDGEITTNVLPVILTDDLINYDGDGLELREAYNDPDEEYYIDCYLFAPAVYPKGTVCIYAISDHSGDDVDDEIENQQLAQKPPQ